MSDVQQKFASVFHNQKLKWSIYRVSIYHKFQSNLIEWFFKQWKVKMKTPHNVSSYYDLWLLPNNACNNEFVKCYWPQNASSKRFFSGMPMNNVLTCRIFWILTKSVRALHSDTTILTETTCTLIKTVTLPLCYISISNSKCSMHVIFLR